MAKERGIVLSATTQSKSGVFDSYIKLTVATGKRVRSIAGTVFSDGKPRFIQIKGIHVDADIRRHMVYVTNRDVPGIIGALGQAFGDAGANIASFNLGRSGIGEDAIALLSLDAAASRDLIERLRSMGLFRQVRPLEFDVGDEGGSDGQ